MRAFSKQPSGQTFPPKTASRMPVPNLVLKQAHLLKFLRSVHTYVRCEGPDPLFTMMLTFQMIFNADIFNQFQYVSFRVVLVDGIFISWLQFFSRQCIDDNERLFNEQSTINVVALKQEENTEY